MDNLLEALKQWQFYLISFVASIVSYKDIWNNEGAVVHLVPTHIVTQVKRVDRDCGSTNREPR
jgi:hypothetical protein